MNGAAASSLGLGLVDLGPTVHANGAPVTRAPYPEGQTGIAVSVDLVARKAREGRLDPAVRGWAGDVLIAAGKPSSSYAQAVAIVDAIRSSTMYVSDPTGAEYVASAAATLCLRPGLCLRAGDCDDRAVVLAAALMSIGIPVQLVIQRFASIGGLPQQQHVLIAFQGEDGSWHYVDTQYDWPIGTAAPAAEEQRIDPLDPKYAPSTANHQNGGAEIIGMGAVPDRHLLKRGSRWWEWVNGEWLVYVDGEWLTPAAARVGLNKVTVPDIKAVGIDKVTMTLGPRGRVGAGAAPPPTGWLSSDVGSVKRGLRYLFGVFVPSGSTRGWIDTVFSLDWAIDEANVNSTSPTGDLWIIKGLARNDAPLITADPDAVTKYDAVYVQDPATTQPGQVPQLPPGTGQPPPEPSGGNLTLGAVIIGGTVVAIAGGVAWGAWKRRHRRAA